MQGTAKNKKRIQFVYKIIIVAIIKEFLKLHKGCILNTWLKFGEIFGTNYVL